MDLGLSMSLVGPNYLVGQKIGAGNFGEIRMGTDMWTNRCVAIKFEPSKGRTVSLDIEYDFYKRLRGGEGIPRVYYFGRCGRFNTLVMDLLGKSLEHLFELCDRKFTLKTVCELAIQMISRIEHVHNKYLVFRDIKPDNFLIGHEKIDPHRIYLVDFGLAKEYMDPKTGEHISFKGSQSITGTVRYMSCNAHNGKETSRRDDLEALGYIFVYFLKGSLPWQGLKNSSLVHRYKMISEKKSNTLLTTLCSELPKEFTTYLKITRSLDFFETPDYEFLKNLFFKVMKREKITRDKKFDWSEKLAANSVPETESNPSNGSNKTGKYLNASCPSLRSPENGFMVSDERSACRGEIGNVCRLSCQRNYIASGDSERVCQPSGEWSGRQGTCVDPSVRCLPRLVAPNNGFIDGECFNWGGYVCTFACNNGYTISGSSNVKCDRSSRRWTNPVPTCVREVVTCPPLHPPDNGIQSGDCDGTNSLIGTRCRFSCDSGYELQGDRSLVCQPSGSWNGFVPLCVASAINCRSLRAPENGYTTGDCENNPSQGSRCTFHCNSGYTLQGRSVLTCTSDGNWNGNLPSCVRHSTSCRRLTTPENGAMRCNQGMSVGSRCLFSCNSGYKIDGQKVLICLENGSWSGAEPHCESSTPTPTCSALDEPRSGKKDGVCNEGAAVGSVCRFSCNAGYHLKGASRLVCQADGSWDNEVPECVRETVACPALSAPANGSRQGPCVTTSPVGSVCVFSCNSGFRLHGERVLMCLASGQWNSTSPMCVESKTNCPALKAPTNGANSGMCGSQSTPGSRCDFSCNSGYTLQGTPVLMCQANGRWNHPVPTCTQQEQEPTCPALDAPENGSKGGACFEGSRVGASCAFRCNNGYILSGKETLVCQVDGTWDEDVPECQEEPKNCPSLPNPVGGTSTGDCNPGLDNRLCAFSCNRGYYLIGTPVLLCKDGKWSSRAPTCQRSSRGGCGLPLVPNGAIITFCKTLVGGRCYFACRYSSLRNRAVDNMRRPDDLPRDVYSVCQPNGRWRGRLISCRPGISSVSWILGFPFG